VGFANRNGGGETTVQFEPSAGVYFTHAEGSNRGLKGQAVVHRKRQTLKVSNGNITPSRGETKGARV